MQGWTIPWVDKPKESSKKSARCWMICRRKTERVCCERFNLLLGPALVKYLGRLSS